MDCPQQVYFPNGSGRGDGIDGQPNYADPGLCVGKEMQGGVQIDLGA